MVFGLVLLVGQINNIFHKNRSLGDTSTKFGTNDVHDLYFKKCTLPIKKIQDGCHFSRWPTCQSYQLQAF